MTKKLTKDDLQSKIDALEKQLDNCTKRLALFEQFVESSGDGMGWADLDSNVRYANPALCRMFGEKRPEDLYGRSVLEFYHKETQEEINTEVIPIVLKEGEWSGELTIQSRAGRQLPTFNTLHVLKDEHGSAISYANVLVENVNKDQRSKRTRNT